VAIAHMVYIMPYRAFDPDIVQVMGQAFDVAAGELHDTRKPTPMRELLAKRVIDFVAAGERDPEEAARRALEALGIVRH